MENVKTLMEQILDGVNNVLAENESAFTTLEYLIGGTLNVDANSNTIEEGEFGPKALSGRTLEIFKALGVKQIDINIAIQVMDWEPTKTDNVQLADLYKLNVEQATAFVYMLLDGTLQVDGETENILMCYKTEDNNLEYGTVKQVMDIENIDMFVQYLEEEYKDYTENKNNRVVSVGNKIIDMLLQ